MVCLLSSSMITMVALGWVIFTSFKVSVRVSDKLSISLSSKTLSFMTLIAFTQKGVSSGGSRVNILFSEPRKSSFAEIKKVYTIHKLVECTQWICCIVLHTITLRNHS